ncbi:MAG: amino acid adenylation domain-containing protein [Pseudohongiella sp.]|nr:amino acid adenylation domain-containing protein [Pseudohongiella sp.]
MSQQHSTLDAVSAIIESISGVSVSDLNRDTDLLDLGLDSLMFVRIGRVLESQYRVEISMKRFYDELSNLGALADHLAANGSPLDAAQEEVQKEAQKEAQELKQNPATEAQQHVSQNSAPVLQQSVLPQLPLYPATPAQQAAPIAGSAAAADVNTVMSAHMALMRRYLDGVAAGRHTTVPASPGLNIAPAAISRPAPAPQTANHNDAVETRKKFSGIVTQKEELSTQQRDFIGQLTARLSARCRLSKQMAEEGREYLSDWKYSLQFKQDLKELRFPVVCETASGSRFTDVDGNEYVDIAMGMGVHYFGHSPRFIDDAVRTQLESNLALGPQSRLAPDVARRICALTGHQRAAFFVTGSDAVMLALRLVRAARARDKVVMFAGAYHGICSDVLAGQGESGAVPMSPGLPTGIVNDLIVLDYDAPESLGRIRELADQLAGVLVEPVQSRNPALQPQRFLRQLRALCTELNIPLIFDEMVNGFRQAPGGMQEWFGVKADMSTYGKIIGGGYPLSVIAGNAELMQWIDGGVWHYGDNSAPLTDSIATGGTHNKHPVALAAAAAVLDHIENNPDLFHAARMRMHQLADRINVWFERNAVPLRLTYFGTQFKFESFASAFELELFFYLLLEKGIYTWELHVANLSTEHTQEDADQLLAAIVYAVEQLRAGGFVFRADRLRRQYLPMSSVQKRLYAITQREGAEKPYHLAGAWRLRGTVDAARLEDCIHQVIIRHESLRTAFVVVDGEFYQRIIAEPRFFLDRIDAGPEAVDELLDAYIQPFNLLEPPLIRVALAAENNGTHLLLMDVHHIVADGLSMNVVLQEILALYDGERLEPVRSQTRHVQDAITQYLAGDRAREDSRYWLETLTPFVATQETFDLSPDFSRPPVTSFAGRRIALKLDTESTAALHRFCTRSRISTFGALFAVFVAWTWRYARQRQFVVGLPGSGRPDAAADNAVGMFVNTLAFPASINEHSSVNEFLQQIRDQLFEVQAHSDYPFSALLGALNISHRANRNPLFDVMFSYENAGSRTIKTNSFEGETLTQYEGAGMFDISLDLIEAENSVLINCAYAESLFSEATMTRRIGEYLTLLETLVAGDAGTVVDWVNSAFTVPEPTPPANVGARVAMLHSGSRTATRSTAKSAKVPQTASARVTPDTIYSQWKQQVASGAHTIALIEGDRQLTYAQVDNLVTETAFTLFNLYGVRAGDRVVVSLDSSIDLITAMLALFSMGAVYVPVTPDTPLARVRLILQQCDAHYLIHATGHACVPELTDSKTVECIAMEVLNKRAIATTRHQSLQAPQAEDVAYVIFTSGSTGVPKGVEILHSGITNSVAWRIREYRLGRADTTLQMPSAGFDASLIDILSALLSGGRLVMIDTASKRSVERIRENIEQHHVTSILLTPTLYRVLLERIPASVSSLRFVTVAGEKLAPDLMQAHFACVPMVELWNEYGPTECSVVVSGGRLSPDLDRVTIGWPIANTQVFILDEQERPLPTGVWGRLWVTGIGLAKGYAGDELTTNSKFRCLSALGNIRCYDTGDVARLLDTGALEFKGRDDGQVKVNGYRIELDDVETALRSQLGLSEVAVNVIDKGNSASLHAWVVADAVPVGWRENLLTVLPAWMVPAALHSVASLPMLPSGKLNRRALVPPADVATTGIAADIVESLPIDSNLALLLSHCREILGRPDLKPGDNYFSAGGDSIQAIVLASRLNEAGYLLDVNELFRNPVLSDLARNIKLKGSKPGRVLPSSAVLLPTPMQLWFSATNKGDPNAFTQAAWLRLPSGITLVQVTELCRHWAKQHAVFQDTCALSIDKLVHCTEQESGADPDAVALAAHADINLQHGPLMRLVLVRTGAHTRALVVFHHFIVDAVSWQLLQSQWAQLWADIEQGKRMRELPEGATMRQFASVLHSEEARHKSLSEAPFWLAMAAACKPVFTVDNNRQKQAHQRLHLATRFDTQVAETLLATGHRVFRSRGSDLLLAAFTNAVASVCKIDAVTVLMESNGRAQTYADADFSTTLGWMTSAYPLRFDSLGSGKHTEDWAEKVERVRELTMRVPEQGVGYGVLRHIVKHDALATAAPEFAFNYLGRFKHHADVDFAMLDETPAGDSMGESGLLPALELVCFADDAGLHVSMSADAALVDSEIFEQILDTFRHQTLDLAAACQALTEPVLPSPVDFVETDWPLNEYLGLLDANSINRTDVANIVPVTAMQSGLIFHARSRPDDLAYLEQVDFTLHGVEADRLALAFQRLLEEFPLLRAGFVVGSNGRTAQLIRNSVTLPVVCHDLSGLTPQQQQRVLDEARETDQLTQFDISRAPLMRVQLFTLQKQGKKPTTAPASRVHVIWTHHHLIMDGWCVGILFDRLMHCYDNLTVGAATAGANNAKSVDVGNNRLNQDYFRWLAARDKSVSTGYWSTLLTGVELPTRLLPWPRLDTEPVDQRKGYQLQRHTVQLSPALTTGMRAFGASKNATLSSVIRLAWAVLLARFSNSADVVYGTVVSGRPAEVAGIDSAVGLFINTVPVRFVLDDVITANDALTLVQQQANASRHHEYLSLAEIQAAAPDLRAREPLFDHLVVLENYPMDAALRGTDAHEKDVHQSAVKSSAGADNAAAVSISDIRAYERTDLPLNLVLVPTSAGLEATFLFDAAVYPSRQIEHLAEHFAHVVQVLVHAPDQALASLDLLTPAENSWLFDQWNQRQSAYPTDPTLYDLYSDAASRNGEGIALRDEHGAITHAELYARVQAVAAGLLACEDFAPGRRVALWLPRNREMITGMLAVLAAGGSYVALDPVYPEARLRFIVQDSAAALVLTADGMPELNLGARRVDINSLSNHTADPGSLPRFSQESAAYVIYTSGSTGEPKGCEISHRNVVRLLRNQDLDFDFDHKDVWIVAHSFCFDFSVWEMYGALLNGGTLVIPAVADVRNVETFVDLVARHQVTVLNQTPAAFYQFIRAALKKPATDLAALRLVVFGGDSLACNRLAPWVAAFPVTRVKLVNMYGITETTVHVSYREVSEADVLNGSHLNLVGRPLPETGVWIVDRCGQLQPPGIAGEIVVSGSGVGMGYLNRPELTTRKFALLASAGKNGTDNQRCYWSGDVGYISPELGLVYLGRNDHQVQVRGFRVECEEIARCLENHQSVAEALVMPIENTHGTELVAYLVGDETAAPAQWRPWLSTRLPDYMIPAYTLWLDALPMTNNGKIDRAALPDPFYLVQAPAAEPPTDIERKIIDAWQHVLEHKQIGPLTNFFEIGGHSLKALTLVDVLQTRFGFSVNVADVFEFPTPRQQAALCAKPGSQASAADDDIAALLKDMAIEDVGLDAIEALLADVSDKRRDS